MKNRRLRKPEHPDTEALLSPLENQIQGIDKRVTSLDSSAVKYDDELYIASKNYPNLFVRHAGWTLRIGGNENPPYELDRTWIIKSK